MAERKKMSVAEILAAARKMDGGASSEGGDQPAPEEAAPEKPAPQESGQETRPEEQAEPAAEAASEPEGSQQPAATGGDEASPSAAEKMKEGKRPSVAEMLAMARAEKSGGAKPAATKPAAKPADKPAAKAPAKPAAKTSPKAPPAEKGKPEKGKPEKGRPATTASILAAARAADAKSRFGPVSKADARKKAAPTKPDRDEGAPAVKAKPKVTVPPMPAKPDYAKKAKPERAAPEEERRGFLKMSALMVGTGLGVGFASLATTLGLWTLGTARFMFPNILTEPPSSFKIGFPADFAPGEVITKFKAQFGVWVVNSEYNGERQIYALSTVCTHLGCTPNWLEAEQKFKCPCHGSGFYKDGINFEGPAPRPLERYAVRVADDGQLEVDKSKKFQEEKGEWANTESFVLA